jgi:hypothetical protein
MFLVQNHCFQYSQIDFNYYCLSTETEVQSGVLATLDTNSGGEKVCPLAAVLENGLQ